MSESPARMEFETFAHIAGDAVQALRTLGTTAAASGLEQSLLELIKLRASQLNGCAFCIQFHLNLARKMGVPAEKLDLVAAWEDAGVHSAREMAALAWCEALTRHAARGASDAAYDAVRRVFSESETVFLTVAVGTINQWNGIAGALRFTPPIPKPAA
jgi:AhpD family alkylhydroperoxidase